MEREWAHMGMMEIEEKHEEFSNKVVRMVLEYNLNFIAEELDSSIIPNQMEFVGYRERKTNPLWGGEPEDEEMWNEEEFRGCGEYGLPQV